jgi:hypothetical protein
MEMVDRKRLISGDAKEDEQQKLFEQRMMYSAGDFEIIQPADRGDLDDEPEGEIDDDDEEGQESKD